MLKVNVRVQPRASRNEIMRQEGDIWWIRLTAPPVEGKANAALIDYLADLLGMPKSNISIARGLTGRQKAVVIQGMAQEDVHGRLRGALAKGA